MAKFAKKPCAYCGGRGRVVGMGIVPSGKTCVACDGYGFVFVLASFIKCADCGGTGRKSSGGSFPEFVRCKRCKGVGWSEPALAHRPG